MPADILLVDDDDGVLRALERVLRRAGHQVCAMDDPVAALESCLTNRYDLVISDYRMPVMNGIEFLSAVRVSFPDMVRMVLSGEADRAGILASINKAGAFRFLTKPWEEAELLDAVAEAAAQRHANQEVADALESHRSANDQSYRRQKLLDALEKETPGITEVNWSPNQTIIIDDGDL